jgi:regulator of sigma D
VDRYGNLLIDNYVHDREQVLVKFRELLEQTASK